MFKLPILWTEHYTFYHLIYSYLKIYNLYNKQKTLNLCCNFIKVQSKYISLVDVYHHFKTNDIDCEKIIDIRKTKYKTFQNIFNLYIIVKVLTRLYEENCNLDNYKILTVFIILRNLYMEWSTYQSKLLFCELDCVNYREDLFFDTNIPHLNDCAIFDQMIISMYHYYILFMCQNAKKQYCIPIVYVEFLYNVILRIDKHSSFNQYFADIHLLIFIINAFSKTPMFFTNRLVFCLNRYFEKFVILGKILCGETHLPIGLMCQNYINLTNIVIQNSSYLDQKNLNDIFKIQNNLHIILSAILRKQDG